MKGECLLKEGEMHKNALRRIAPTIHSMRSGQDCGCNPEGYVAIVPHLAFESKIFLLLVIFVHVRMLRVYKTIACFGQKERIAMEKIDDGYYSWLVKAATFDKVLDMPIIALPKRMEIPKNLIPFSKMAYSAECAEYVHFYEHDMVFREFVRNPEKYIEHLYKFPGVVTPDCSLYRDMPLILQMANVYISRSIGCYLQEQGMNVIPNVRWGDERSYRPGITDVPFAFLGIEKHSIVSVSTYGCIRGKENKRHFHDGFQAMLTFLAPEIVLLHGAMPADVFYDIPGM